MNTPLIIPIKAAAMGNENTGISCRTNGPTANVEIRIHSAYSIGVCTLGVLIKTLLALRNKSVAAHTPASG